MTSTRELADRVRRNALRMVHSAKASHIGGALSIADILAVLYGGVLRFDADDPSSDDRDRFILSKGHACVAVYSVLAEVGLIGHDVLSTYGNDFSWLMNHISHKVDGVEFSTGSLGHGLPFGVGKALAAKMRRRAWRTFVILSDGEMDEGSNWEALMFAAHHGLSNLTAVIDCNNLQSLDTVSNTLGLEPLADKLAAFGCRVHDIDGHDHETLLAVLGSVDERRPTAIVARTVKGKGVSFMEGRVEWHYKNPDDDQLARALADLDAANA